MTGPLAGLSRDLHHGARRLAASPVFLVFAVVSLAIGLSVTTAAYSILYSLFWKPIDANHPDRVVMVTSAWSAPRWRLAMSQPDFEDLLARQTTFSVIGASATVSQTVVSPARSELTAMEAVTGDYFTAFGVRPALGRLLQPSDGNANVAVLSHRLWRTRFHADPEIVGQVVRIGGQPFEIVGVAPRSFAGLSRMPRATPLWVPLDAAAPFAMGRWSRAERGRAALAVVARLAPGQSVTQASSEVSVVGDGLDRTFPRRDVQTSRGAVRMRRQWAAEPIQKSLAPPDTRIGILLIGLIALVLVVACANLANLTLARGAIRQQEVAVRRALGASRWRVMRELLVESGIVAVLGSALGLALTRVLLVFGTIEIPFSHGSLALDPALNWPALAAAAVSVLLSLVVFGLAPAIQLTRTSVTVDLSAERASVGSPRSARQRLLIGGQVAVSTCFFLVTAILVRIIVAGAAHDPGIALDRLALTTVHFGLLGWDEPRARDAVDRAAGIARRQPEIESVAVSSGMPFGQLFTPTVEVTTPDKPFVESNIGGRYESAALLASTPQIFATLQVPLVRGRAFDDRDHAGAPKVAVISERTSRALFGTVDGVGRELLLNFSTQRPVERLTVIGVTKDTDVRRYMSRKEGAVFVPLSQRYVPTLVLSARTSGNPAAAVGMLQESLRQADPELVAGMAGTATTLLAAEVVAARLAGALAAALGLVMIVLAMVGLYGIQMHVVASRTREVGVRMALGATVEQIQRMILRQGYRPVIEGVALGMVFGVIARMGLRAVVVAEIQAVDPLAIVLVPIPLVVAAFLACWLPARRASRVDPNVALRHL